MVEGTQASPLKKTSSWMLFLAPFHVSFPAYRTDRKFGLPDLFMELDTRLRQRLSSHLQTFTGHQCVNTYIYIYIKVPITYVCVCVCLRILGYSSPQMYVHFMQEFTFPALFMPSVETKSGSPKFPHVSLQTAAGRGGRGARHLLGC